MNHIKFDVTFLGNAIIDIIAKTTDQLLDELSIPKGSMQLVNTETADNLLKNINDPIIVSGGSAANTAVGFSSFGGKACFLGQVGKDKFGELFIKNINESGVFFQNKKTNNFIKTSKSIILVTPDAERTMNTFLGASAAFDTHSLNENLIINSKLLYIEGYLFDQQDAKKAIYHSCKLAIENDVKIALSLSDLFCVDRHRRDFLDLIKKYVDIIFANETEIKNLYKSNLKYSVKNIRSDTKMGAITLGSKGSIVFDEDGSHNIDPVAIATPTDTTGAGDLFASGFLYGLIKNYSLIKCGHLGTHAAGEIITHYGARPEISLKTILDHNFNK